VALVAAVIIAILAAASKSQTETALGEVRAMIGPGTDVTVRSCRHVASDADTDTFRCSLKAPNCQRTYLFMSSKVASFDNLAIADKSDAVLVRPCAFPSDRLLPGEKPS
jgi:hypothetical protein